MKILPVSKIQECDKYTIENEPVKSIDLMERASLQLFKFISSYYDKNEEFVIFTGSGNNGGDVLALARLLFNDDYKNIIVYLLEIGNRSEDCIENLNRLNQINGVFVQEININDPFPHLESNSVVIDGIFGSGLNRPVTGYWGDLINYINENTSEIIAIDIPSGLFGENNSENSGCIIKANITLTFQFPKLSFFFSENSQFVGEWKVLDIKLHKGYIEEAETVTFLIHEDNLADKLIVRNRFSHKGTFGHAFLIAGSYGKTGAAVLAAKACLRSGVGLLTVHVPESGYEIMQTAVPEAMLCIDETEMNYCSGPNIEKFSTIGIGPGIGMKKSMQNAFLQILENQTSPMVIDADAINILAGNKKWLSKIPKNSILTPHSGEFDRLIAEHQSGYGRYLSQKRFSLKYKVIIILKGAYTSISDIEGNVYFNSTGNPGMATAGSGDVLTGIILSLLSQGYKSIDAARLGVFIHGLAGDIANETVGNESLIASDVINNLGNAFKKLKGF